MLVVAHPKGSHVKSIYSPLYRMSVIFLLTALTLVPANLFAADLTEITSLSPAYGHLVDMADTPSADGVQPSSKKNDPKSTKTTAAQEDTKDKKGKKGSKSAKVPRKAGAEKVLENMEDAGLKHSQHKKSVDTGASESTPEPQDDGPAWPSFWAKHQIMDYHAHDDGSINEWAPGYYVAHSTSEAGQAIHASDVGSVIIIDGTPVTIDSRQYRSEYESYEGIRETFGSNCVIFQTCADGDMNLVLTGHADGWGPFETVGGGLDANGNPVEEEHVTYVNAYGEFSSYEEAEAARIAMEEQEAQEEQAFAVGMIASSATEPWESSGGSLIEGSIG